MTITEEILTVVMCIVGTMATRFLPFMIFSDKRPTPKYIRYLGDTLPLAVFALLIVYSLKDVSVFSFPYGLPEALGIAVTILLHLWLKQMLVSIAGGTAIYMLAVQFVFV